MEHVNAKVKDSLLLRNKNKRDGYLVSRKPAPRLNTHPFFWVIMYHYLGIL